MKPLAVDLCAGLGGWSHGLLAEGWDCIGFDIERHQYGEARYPAQLVLPGHPNAQRPAVSRKGAVDRRQSTLSKVGELYT